MLVLLCVMCYDAPLSAIRTSPQRLILNYATELVSARYNYVFYETTTSTCVRIIQRVWRRVLRRFSPNSTVQAGNVVRAERGLAAMVKGEVHLRTLKPSLQ